MSARASRALLCRAALCLTAVLLCPRSASGQFYVDAVRGRTLTEGLGIEGVLTVFDETPRMYRSLGDPRREPQYPLWYFYDQGPFRLTIRAEVNEGRFQLRSILYTGDRGDPKALVTSQGLRLGASVARVVEVYGEAEQSTEKELGYQSRGVTFHIGRQQQVIGITVFRPSGRPGPDDRRHAKRPEPAQPTPEPASPQEVEPDKEPAKPDLPPVPDPARPLTLPDLLLHVPDAGGWKAVEPLTPDGGKLSTADGRLELEVRVCRDCAQALVEAVRELEAQMPPNLVPRDLTDLDDRSLELLNAERGYIGRYVHPRQGWPTWLVAMRKGDRSYMLVLALRTGDGPVDQRLLQKTAEALSGIRILDPQGGGAR